MGRPNVNLQFSEGPVLHRYVTSVDSALTSTTYASQSTPTDLQSTIGAFPTNRAATVEMRVWLADSGNGSGNGGDTADIYIVGWPYVTTENLKDPKLADLGQYRASAHLIGAFEVTSATSSDNASAHITDINPITGVAVADTDFFEAELVDFDDFITSADEPSQIRTYSAAGATASSQAVDGLGLPIWWLIDTTAYEYIKVFVTAFGGDADIACISLRRVD